MKHSRFSIGLIALAIIGVATLNSCNKDVITSGLNNVSTTLQKNGISTDAVESRGIGPSANGQGALRLDYMNGRVQHFAFHANTDSEGNVTGTWESKSPGQDGRAHGVIDCLRILDDGKTAIMSGYVTQVVGDGYVLVFGIEVGDPIWLKVRDNGEGANATSDALTDIQGVPFGFSCAIDIGDLDLYQIENGNIQVKP